MSVDTKRAKAIILSGLALVLLGITTIAAAAVVMTVVRLGSSTLTAWLWPNSAAPWEEVHATYYPDKRDLTADVRWRVGSVEECRSWVVKTALASGDSMRPIIELGRIPQFVRGDYECGVGFAGKYGPNIDVYRLTLR